MKDNFNALDFGKAIVETILFWFFTLGIIFLSYWSFEQTWIFVRSGNPVEVAFWLAISIQYGQNVFLFMAGVHKDKTWEINEKITLRYRDLYLMSFAILACIDAGTNVGQWRVNNPEIASTINVASITWTLICIGVIFVEELLVISLSAALYKTNDLLESIGFGRIDIFDAFEKNKTRLVENKQVKNKNEFRELEERRLNEVMEEKNTNREFEKHNKFSNQSKQNNNQQKKKRGNPNWTRGMDSPNKGNFKEREDNIIFAKDNKFE